MELKEKNIQIGKSLLAEFEHEIISTRRHLERLSDSRLNWKPHEKSMTMGQLAHHLVSIPGWTEGIMTKDEWVVTMPFKYEETRTVSELLEIFDRNIGSAKKILSESDDESFMKPWSMVADGKKLVTMPRIAVVRSFVFSHSYHHRAQLGVYLRLNDIPVPATYGPSADEQSM